MNSIIVASEKPKTGKTMVGSVLCSYLQSKNIKVGAISSLFDPQDSESVIPDWLKDIEVIPGMLGKAPKKTSSDLIGRAGLEIKKLSKNSLITESHLKTLEENKELAESSESKLVYVCDKDSDISKIKEVLGPSLLGIVINNVPRYQIESLKMSLQDSNPILGFIPENRYMVSSTVDQYANHMKGKYLYESERKNDLILNVLIGGIVLDWSVLYYKSKQNVLAIIRGDRPDLHLGAMQSGTVNALMLTKAIEPIEYVYYEAKKLEIPIISVETDTHETANLVEGIVEKSVFDHPEKLNKMVIEFEKNMNFDLVSNLLETSTP